MTRFVFLLATLLFAEMGLGAQVADQYAPEQASARQQQQLVRGKDFMVVSANPIATKVGYEVLAEGGNAIDALVAVQVMLGLVEPQSSGLGGGAFALYYQADSDQLHSFDGRETAPIAAHPDLFLDNKGQPLSFYQAVVGGLSVGTPATPKLLAELHRRYGSLPLLRLMTPTIQLAEVGFQVSPRLAGAIAADIDRLGSDPETLAYFTTPEGAPLPVGHLLKNPSYARTLRTLAVHGLDSFYQGAIGSRVISKVRQSANPGLLAKVDLERYEVKERPPVCIDYRQYQVCGMGPPSSGAQTVGQTLGMLSHFDLPAMGVDSAEAWHLLGEASRLAFADRGRYMADTDFVSQPGGLLDAGYLAKRAALLSSAKVLENEQVVPGNPPWAHPVSRTDDASIEFPSTSHFVIVDAQGNVVSMTSTIENGFGSRLMTGGFLLNNELTDFSFLAEKNGRPVANRVEPGKRPRSSMSPTIVFKEGKPYLALGSPGGSRIIGYVLKTLVAHLDWGLDIQAAIDLPNAVKRFGQYDVEQLEAADLLAAALATMGHLIKRTELNSGLHAIRLVDGGLEGAADPRREGQPLGR